jgi:hypothetical protein
MGHKKMGPVSHKVGFFFFKVKKGNQLIFRPK